MRLEETSSNTSRVVELEKEAKEKTLLIGKLRHEGSFLVCFTYLKDAESHD